MTSKLAANLDGTDPEEFTDGSPRPAKRMITIRLDPDILAWFRAQGPNYQTRMNQALRYLMVCQANERTRDNPAA